MPNPKPNKWAGILLIAGTVLLIIIIVILTILISERNIDKYIKISYPAYPIAR